MADLVVEQKSNGSLVVDAGLVTRVVVPPGGPRSPREDPNDDGYPDIISDQRTGYATPDASTADDVFQIWEQFLERQGKEINVTDAEVIPYINHSRWVADCTCGGGMLCWDQNPYACCLDCGRRFNVRWQPPVLRAAVIRTIATRQPQHRNWDPRRVNADGTMIEDIAFLERENVLMGV